MRFLNQGGGVSTGTALPNTLPLNEVSLFLLFVLMGAAGGESAHELPVNPAKVPSAAPAGRPSKLFKVTVTASGGYGIWGKPADADQVKARIAALKPGTTVVLEPDRDARYEAVALVLSAAYEAKLPCVEQVQKKGEGKP